MKLLELKKDLEWRGLLKDIANEESLTKIVEKSSKFYVGIDPTADSLHLGHFLSLNLARILSKYGLKPLIVIGGFTGMIGDPSGKNREREIICRNTIRDNVNALTNQINEIGKKLIIDDLEIFDNSNIYNSLSLVDFFQKYGKIFNINTMLSKEAVKNRIRNGISYTEFSYQVFQSIDFLWLFQEKGIRLQLGGSDQWGNITAGIDLIRKVEGNDQEVAGITINLLTDEQGNKIGKTQGKPLWLDKSKTSSYLLHQFFINQSDLMAEKLIAQITDIKKIKYDELLVKSKKNPSKKLIQIELSKKFISTIHSKEDFESAIALSNLLFEEKYHHLTKEQISLLNGIPSFTNNSNLPLVSLLINNKLVKSKREFRELIAVGAIKINGKSVNNENTFLNDFILDKVSFITVGKKNKYIVWK